MNSFIAKCSKAPGIKKSFILILLSLVVFWQPVWGKPKAIQSFQQSKKKLRAIYKQYPYTFYCGCQIERTHMRKPLLSTCGYKPRKSLNRARRIEWEHVVPAHAFGQAFPEWREGHESCVKKSGKPYKGRKCAAKVNKLFQAMEADMHNLFPSIGEVNGDRSNYSMAVLPGESREYGDCDVEIQSRKIEPRPSIRGEIARVYLYMDRAYPGKGIISRKNRKLFESWNATDPVDAWECKRERLVANLQGTVNEFVRRPCNEKGL